MPSNFARINNGSFTKVSSSTIYPLSGIYKKSLNSQRRVKVQLQTQHRFSSQVRHSSTTTSISAFNARKGIPVQLQHLHSSLNALHHDAILHLDLSQLKLALRGLESERLVTRIAILGIHGQQGARRLVRALLADPLRPEPEWERQLLEAEDGDGKGLLLRYSESSNFDERHPLVRTLSVPCSTLQAHNLEIFIQSLPSNLGPPSERPYGFLVPNMDIPVDDSGRASIITYPVHKSLIYTSNLDDVSAFTRNIYPEVPSDNIERHVVKGVIDRPWEKLNQESELRPMLSPINLVQAEDAIRSFRSSLDLAIKYEYSWFSSGLAEIAKWAFPEIVENPSILQPSLRRLIEIITDNALRRLSQEEQNLFRQRQASATEAASVKKVLSQRLVTWAESAHGDLRDQLGLAFMGKNWKKLAWWKLFWRIDDVGFITSDILQRSWLVQAERTMIWLSGQINQACHVEAPQYSDRTVTMEDSETNLSSASIGGAELPAYAYGSAPPARRASDIVAEISLKAIAESTLKEDSYAYPWPQDISRARSFLLKTTIPSLQALCQGLLLQTISTTALTSLLSTLLYVSISTTSIYEAGAIAAVGFLYSLQRLQKKWNLAKGVWEATIKEEGRRILRGLEEKIRTSLREEDKGPPDTFAEKNRLAARKALELVQKELNRLNENGKIDTIEAEGNINPKGAKKNMI